jgi:outer membrane receptor protein involved in Fe transport
MLVSKSHCSPFALACASLVLASTLCLAQTEDAMISGRVTDTTGTVLPNAEVLLQSAERRTTTATKTNEEGIYNFPAVQPGVYHITVRKVGFRQVDFVGLTVNVQAHIDQNFGLQFGATSESITITGNASILNTESSAVSTVVDQQFVENMPLNGRSFQSLIALVPGITFTPADYGSPGQFSVSGQRTDANYFVVDGVSANIGVAVSSIFMGATLAGTTPGWTIGGGTNGMVSVDAMQEFSIQTSSEVAEFGRSPGGQISIATKSGTNQWHGNAFNYLRNDVFDARDWFNKVPATKPPLRQNDFGGTLGGPIWKSKTFFFFSYEGLHLLLPQSATGHFYTPAARVLCPSSGPMPTLCVSAAWKPIVDAQPVPNGPVDPNGITALLTASYSIPTNFNAISSRIDHSLTRKISFFMRYNHAPSNGLGRSFAQVFKNQANTDTATAGVTINFSPNMVNDFRANWSRSTGPTNQYNDNFMGAVPPPASTVFGPYNSATAQTIWLFNDSDGGVREGLFSGNVQRQLNFVDNFSLTVGTHQLKFGVDWRRLTPTSAFFHPSVLTFDNTYLNLQAGTLARFNIADFGHSTNVLVNNYSLYAQDTWKTTNKLTLTYGLRWEINPPPAATATNAPFYHVTGVFDTQPSDMVTTSLYGTKLGSFAPRLGAAYQLTPRTVVRAGFGLFYDLGVSSVIANTLAGTYPWYRSNDPGLGVPFDWNTLPGPPPFPNPLTPPNGSHADAGGGAVAAVDPNLVLPVTYQWNVAVERQLGQSQSLTVSYVGASGRNLIRTDYIEPVPSTSPWDTVSVVRNADRSNYNALQTEFRRRLSHGLQVLASYTFAKSMDTSSADYGNSIGAQTLAQLSNVAELNYGYSDFDVRHNYSVGVSYELPAPQWGGVGNVVLKGWAIDTLTRGRSGYPFTVKNFADQILLNGILQQTRPNVVHGQPVWLDTPTAPGGRVLNPAAFTAPTNNLPGDEVRNSYRDFGAAQTDIAVRRRFSLTERVKLDFRVEYFNLFNHPMFSLQPYGFYYGFPSFGIASQTLGTAFSGNYGAGQNKLYTVGGNRSGQFTLKLSF